MSKHNSFIKQSVTIKSPRNQVFNALTQANRLMRWFPTLSESDPRPGGKLMLTWEFENANENGSQEGKYVEVIPNEKVSYTWNADSVPTLVTFDLKDVKGETVVELDHSTDQDGVDEKKLQEDHNNQWGFFLINLKGYLEAGADLRKEKLNQITM